ncbi:hypothetical protein AAVH_11724 [Aphelenchoides avenae]|nr:hypothetical protein AAVH_11724 [Aphelenchus avenae]
MPSLHEETITHFGDELMRENERLEQELEATQQKLHAVELEMVEKSETAAQQLQSVTDRLTAALAGQEDRASEAVAKQGELENQLAASQLQVFELSERVQTLQHELREGSAHEQQAPARVEDPRVPQLLAEVEALKNQKEALENTLSKASEQLHEAVSEKESLKARISRMLDEIESFEDAVAQYRKEAEEYKAQAIVLQERLGALDRPGVSLQENSISAKVNNSQMDHGKTARALHNENQELKSVGAMRRVDANGMASLLRHPDLDGATLEAFKMSEQSVSDYRQQVRSLEDKVDRLEKENARLSAPAQPNPRQRLSMAMKDTFEREKKQLVTRVRNLEAELETQKKALLQQLERNASVHCLEAEVKRLTDLVELLRYPPPRQKRDTVKPQNEHCASAGSLCVKLEPPSQHVEAPAPAVSLQNVKKERAEW